MSKGLIGRLPAKSRDLGPVAGVRQVKERTKAYPALTGVCVEGPCDVVLLKHALQPLQDRSEPIGGDRHVVDERDRPRSPAKPISSAARSPRSTWPIERKAIGDRNGVSSDHAAGDRAQAQRRHPDVGPRAQPSRGGRLV